MALTFSRNHIHLILSTLRNVIEATGGELDIRAVFLDGAVRIKTLKELKK